MINMELDELRIGMKVAIREENKTGRNDPAYTVLQIRDLPNGAIAWLDGLDDWVPLDRLLPAENESND